MSRLFVVFSMLSLLGLLVAAGCQDREPAAEDATIAPEHTPEAETVASPLPEPTVSSTASPAQTPTPEASPPSLPSPAPGPTVQRSDALTTDELKLHLGEPGVVKLSWETQSEKNNFGFYVYRSASEEGPFEPINEKIILGAGNSSTRNAYEYYDTTVKIGELYYYYVEAVDIYGHREPFTPTYPARVRHLWLNPTENDEESTETTLIESAQR